MITANVSRPWGAIIMGPLLLAISLADRVILTSAAAAHARASGLPPQTVTDSKPVVREITRSATEDTSASNVKKVVLFTYWKLRETRNIIKYGGSARTSASCEDRSRKRNVELPSLSLVVLRIAISKRTSWICSRSHALTPTMG